MDNLNDDDFIEQHIEQLEEIKRIDDRHNLKKSNDDKEYFYCVRNVNIGSLRRSITDIEKESNAMLEERKTKIKSMYKEELAMDQDIEEELNKMAYEQCDSWRWMKLKELVGGL